jgi:hypothetical protein
MDSDPISHQVSSVARKAAGAARVVQMPAVIALMIAVTGCGGGDELNRVEIQGDVTVNGTPVKAGRVTFIPEGGTRGPASGAPISGGKFVIPLDRGPVPGKYAVRVQIDDPVPAADAGSAAAPVEFRPPTKEEVLAGKDESQPVESSPSNATSELDPAEPPQDTTPEFHVTVTAEGPNQFDLAVGGEVIGP